MATGTRDVYTAELNPQTAEVSTPPTHLTERFVGSNLAGAWSPVGQRFAYFSQRGPLPGPGSQPKRTPIPWNAAEPYKGLGFRGVTAKSADLAIAEFPVQKA